MARHSNPTKELQKSLKIAVNEKDVENAYRQALAKYFPAKTNSPHKVDGLLDAAITSLLEFKNDVQLKGKLDQCSVIIQTLFYLKKLERKGIPLPKSIFIGDKDECLCLPVSKVSKYLVSNGIKIDWDKAPSRAAANNPELLQKMVNDGELKPFVFNINSKSFDFDIIVEKLKAIEEDKDFAVAITRENIVEIFSYFEEHVVKDKKYKFKTLFDEENQERLSRLADVFFNCLIDSEDTYIHPKKKNTLISKGEKVVVNANVFRSFFSHFKRDYTPSELEALTANKDRIFEEIYRRRTGAYFTPTIWVNEAHKMIGETLGEDWKDEYVVWDCCAGTANLTRDYNFKELYISTLEQGDIDTINDMGYNKGATVFKYDFLSEIGLGDEVPQELKDAFESGKKVLFFINPPYGTAGNLELDKEKKTSVAKTEINKIMLDEGIGSSAQQLYSQFLFKLAKLNIIHKNVSVSIFCPPLLFAGSSFKTFRKKVMTCFSFCKGILFQASNFADVKNQWGISFATWEPK